MPHKFKIGDIVAINPAISRFVPGGVFEVVKWLPGNDGPNIASRTPTNRISAWHAKANSSRLRGSHKSR